MFKTVQCAGVSDGNPGGPLGEETYSHARTKKRGKGGVFHDETRRKHRKNEGKGVCFEVSNTPPLFVLWGVKLDRFSSMGVNFSLKWPPRALF